MPTISGSLKFDSARTNVATGLPGISNIPITVAGVDLTNQVS